MITDASDPVVAGGQTSAAVLAAAHERGTKLFSCPGLHAKVLCLGHYAVVGSTNISASSVHHLLEAAVVTDNPAVVLEARRFILELQTRSRPISKAFLRRIQSIPVQKSSAVPIRGRRKSSSEPPLRTWLIGTSLLDERQFPQEVTHIQRGEAVAQQQRVNVQDQLNWIRYTGKSRFVSEAARNDAVVQIFRSSSTSRSARVYPPALIVSREVEPTCHRFFVEEPSNHEERAIPWTAFRRIWQFASGKPPPPMNCARLLSPPVAQRLLSLWPEVVDS